MRVPDTPISNFTFGDLVVVRCGNAAYPDNVSLPNAGSELPVFLDEYTTKGVYVGTLTVNPNQLTLTNLQGDQHEGALNLSPNHQWLSFAGYATPPKTIPTRPADTDGSIGRVIGLVGNSAASLNGHPRQRLQRRVTVEPESESVHPRRL